MTSKKDNVINEIQNLWTRLTVPFANDPDEALREYMTRVILLMQGIALTVFFIPIVVGWIPGAFPLEAVIIMLSLLVPTIAGIWLAYRRRWQIAKHIPPILFFALGLYLSCIIPLGMTPLLFFILATMLTSLLHGVRAYWLVVGLSLTAYFAIGVGFSQESIQTIIETIIIVGGTFTGIVLLLWFSISQYKRATLKAYKHREELDDANQELHAEIADRKQMEEKLRDSEEQYRAIFEQAADSIVLVDAKAGELLEFNDKAHENLGYTREEFGKLKIPDFEVIESTDEVTKHIEKIIREGFDVFETKHRTKGGDLRDILVNSKAITIGGKEFVLTIWADITERKKTEEALRESEERLRLLIESAEDIIIMQDLEGRYLYYNGPPQYGIKPDDILGKTLFDFHDTSVATKFMERIKRVAENVEGITTESQIYWQKEMMWFEDRISPIKDSSGNVVAVVTISRNITKLKKAEKEKNRLQAQLVLSEKMAGIGTLTSGIAHEFNNLLQIMSGHAEYAQRTKTLEDMEEALEIVGNTSDRVSKIIQDLLTFSRRDTLERGLSRIRELIDFVLSMTEEQLKKNNITVVREYGRVPEIEVNMGEIQQVFLNIVLNARDAMLPRGGKLEIRTRKVKDHVEVSFADTGIGIEEANLGRVFEPFFTTKGAVGGDTRIQGIGLGLSVSYGIVDRHGGTIEVESKAGKGTIFIIRLPVIVKKAKEQVVKEKSKPKAKMTKPRSVLVVDDEEEICKMFTKWLSAEGHKVKSALTGKKALNLVKKEFFDIVFLDIVMPGIPAIDVLAEIKEISLKTKVFMITGKLVDKDLWKELKAKGASGYLQKPFKIENIKNCIAKTKE